MAALGRNKSHTFGEKRLMADCHKLGLFVSVWVGASDWEQAQALCAAKLSKCYSLTFM